MYVIAKEFTKTETKATLGLLCTWSRTSCSLVGTLENQTLHLHVSPSSDGNE